MLRFAAHPECQRLARKDATSAQRWPPERPLEAPSRSAAWPGTAEPRRVEPRPFFCHRSFTRGSQVRIRRHRAGNARPERPRGRNVSLPRALPDGYGDAGTASLIQSALNLVVDTAITLAIVLLFCDETIRKALPDRPVLVTAAKDSLLLFAGGLVWLFTPAVRRLSWFFVPWCLLTLIGSLFVYGQTANSAHLLAVWRTYCLSFLYLGVGYYVGQSDKMWSKTGAIFVVGSVLSVALAAAQEHLRGSLPEALSARIYKIGHPMAGGLYNEGPFASSTILAAVLCAVVVFTYAHVVRSRSKSVWLSAGLLLACSYGIYLSRVRVAIPLAAAGLTLVALIGPPHRQRRGRSWLLFGAMLSLGLVAYLLTAMNDLTLTGETTIVAREVSFFEVVLNPEEIAQRGLFFLNEMRRIEPVKAIWGYGPGLGGAMRRLLENEPECPAVADTGIFLLYVELGVMGLVAFAIAYFGATVQCARQVSFRASSPRVIAGLVVSSCLGLWFLLKMHALIANGATHALWLASLGVALSGLTPGSDIRRPPKSGQPRQTALRGSLPHPRSP